jgi:hypothetical protein
VTFRGVAPHDVRSVGLDARGVSFARPVDLHCEISSLEEPIRGRVSDLSGRSLPFCGWIEFSAALTSLVEDADRQVSIPPNEEQSDE